MRGNAKQGTEWPSLWVWLSGSDAILVATTRPKQEQCGATVSAFPGFLHLYNQHAGTGEARLARSFSAHMYSIWSKLGKILGKSPHLSCSRLLFERQYSDRPRNLSTSKHYKPKMP